MIVNNKILISPKNIEEILEYKKIGITNFLFALSSFSIGYPEFSLEDLSKLDVNVFLNINIIMDTKKINEFKKNIPKLKFIKGIFFEDLGLYNLLKDENIPLIWNQDHFVINTRSINFWNNKVLSSSLSNELTKEEIIYILDNINKPIILPIYGYNRAMYSRRALLTNFTNHYALEPLKEGVLAINKDIDFKTYENDNGTILFFNKPFSYMNIIKDIDDNKVLYYYFDMSKETCKDYLDLKNIKTEEKFLNKKTIYKLED